MKLIDVMSVMSMSCDVTQGFSMDVETQSVELRTEGPGAKVGNIYGLTYWFEVLGAANHDDEVAACCNSGHQHQIH